MTETKSLTSFFDESVWSNSKIIKLDDIRSWAKGQHLKDDAQFTDKEAESDEVKKEPEKLRIDPNLKIKVESVMDLVGIAAEFDWEGVFDLEKKQGFFDEVDCTELEEKRCAIELFREKTLENIIHFVLNCEREGHKERFEEFWHSLRVEYYDGKVMLRYQPIVYDNYD